MTDYRTLVAFVLESLKWTKHADAILEHGWREPSDMLGRIVRASTWKGHTTETLEPLRKAHAALTLIAQAPDDAPVSNPTLDDDHDRPILMFPGWTVRSVAFQVIAMVSFDPTDLTESDARIRAGLQYLVDRHPSGSPALAYMNDA